MMRTSSGIIMERIRARPLGYLVRVCIRLIHICSEEYLGRIARSYTYNHSKLVVPTHTVVRGWPIVIAQATPNQRQGQGVVVRDTP